MNVLVVDVGGNHVKILATGRKQSREFPSGPTLTAKQMVAGVKKLARDWKYDAKQIMERIAVEYPESISVLPVPEVFWSDLGSRERVLRVLRRLSQHQSEKIQAVA